MVRGSRGSSTPRGGWGGRGRGRGRGKANGWASPRDYRSNGNTTLESHGFTLADEARKTSHHDSSWATSTTLRKRPMVFVSAGVSEPLKILEELKDEVQPSNEKAAVELSQGQEPSRMLTPHEESEEEERAKEEPAKPEGDVQVRNGEEESGDDDMVMGPDELEAAIQAAVTTKETPAFFFDVSRKDAKPTTKGTKPVVKVPERPSPPPRVSESEDDVLLFTGRDQRKQKTGQPTEIVMTQMQTEIQLVEDQMQSKQSEEVLVTKQQKKTKRERQRGGKKVRQHKSNDDDEEALVADYLANMRENGEAESILQQYSLNARDLGGTESELSSDEAGNAEPKKPLASEAPKTQAQGQDSATDDDDPFIEADMGGSASELDDETLAKLIAGHGSDFDTAFQMAADDLSDDSDSSDDLIPAKHRHLLVEDGEFDIMDWDRPSLRRKKKGKAAKAQVSFGVSDSELEQTLQAAWSNDRMKKAQRKKQREELRSLGMLGKRAQKPQDLITKYPKGMNVDQIADEFEDFLQDTVETLSLPPMDKHARKVVHELASKFNIKSKSAGKGDFRRPILHRTGRTLPYVEGNFNQAVNKISRRYFPRLDTKGRRSKGSAPTRSGHAEATYKDGEVVGAAAPELGMDNRGRNMLEKMGWSRGTALGATDNKGILQPVTHTMKRTKAGLA